MNNSKLICNNCGKDGHMFYQCKLPIISCGIIVFRLNNDGSYEYLMNMRKNSYGFIDLIRGKYNVNDLKQIQNIVSQMSNAEKTNIFKQDFDLLWKEMWGDSTGYLPPNEYNNSLKKYNALNNTSFKINDTEYSFLEIIKKCKTDWASPEWEFPKGRRNSIKEKDLECALREFEEETGIEKGQLEIVENMISQDECFIGTNCKSYKNKYFLGTLKNPYVKLNNFQKSEVTKLEWLTYEKCLLSIRDNNLEKKSLIKNINNVLEEFRLYS